MNSQELKKKIENREGGYLFYGLTPPKISTDQDKIEGIAQRQMDRLEGLNIDGLILYDIQDESSRNNNPRPFPYMSTYAPDEYANTYLQDLKVPKIIYKSVGKFTETSLLIATHNAGKLEEMVELLTPFGIAVRSASELGLDEPESTCQLD